MKNLKLVKNINSSEIFIKKNDYILQIDEIDETTINNISHLLNENIIDKHQASLCYSYLDFQSQTEEDKYEIVKYANVSPSFAIQFYMSKGISYVESLDRYLNERAFRILNRAESAKKYFHTQKFLFTILSSISEDNIDTFIDDTQILFFKYMEIGYFGSEYGDKKTGILDYIENSGEYKVQGGLKSLNLNPNITYEELKEKLIDILYFGI